MSLLLSPAQQPEPKASILLVADSPTMLRRLRSLLQGDSYQVVTAATGAQALERMRSGYAPMIALLDLPTPGGDDLRTLTSLLRLSPDLKVIMVLAEEDPAQMQRAVTLGAEVFLTKPVSHLYLSAALERCLAMASSPASKYAAASAK